MWPFTRRTPETQQPAPSREPVRPNWSALARVAAEQRAEPAARIAPAELMPGVVPSGKTAAIAMDSAVAACEWATQAFAAQVDGSYQPFPGYPYLAALATRAEYRAAASALSTEMTREWIELTSAEDDDEQTGEKIKQIESEIKRLCLRNVFQMAAEQDAYFGRGQIFIDIRGADRSKPLILSPRTIPIGSLERVTTVEAMWTTPSAYNALDPAAPDFYRPTQWWMLGSETHASRLLTIVTRPLPDMLKPAYNFSGMSLSQLMEPYVNNWLRTRQSVADLINNFSITVLATDMSQVLQGDDDGAGLFNRAAMFTRGRSNLGLMLTDKEREELVQINTPLSGLHELQAQSQEHMCSVTRLPAIVLTGISPSGLNASSDGEIRAFYDWIAAQQEAYYRDPLEIILKVIQLSLFGEIDSNIGFKFRPLWQLDPVEESTIRVNDANADSAYLDRGVIDPTEVREKLARDPESGYDGLDTSVTVFEPPNEDIE